MSVLDYSEYKPSDRFKDLAETDLAHEMWDFIATEDNITEMEKVIKEDKAPVTVIDEELYKRFTDKIEQSSYDTEELKVLAMNMMKQVLEKRGYSHSACAMLLQGKFVKSAGLFQKVS